MSILDQLTVDHREAVALLATILAAGDEQQRNVLFKQFIQEFIAQTKAEDKNLYEPLGKYEDARSTSLYAQQTRRVAVSLAENLAREEHKVSELWTAQCRVLKTMLEQHIREEEDVNLSTGEGNLRRCDAAADGFRVFGTETSVPAVARNDCGSGTATRRALGPTGGTHADARRR